jgi:phytoene dehydrogenase-like protein
MTQQYDAIVIGGGHNGLVAGAMLAKARKRVLVLERRKVLGGAAATEEVWPGFCVNTGAADAGLLQKSVVQELFLKMHGLTFLESEVGLFAPLADSRALTLYRDTAKSTAEISHFSQRDAQRYPAFVQEVERMAGILKEMMLLTPPDVMGRNLGDLSAWGRVGLTVKRLGGPNMMTFLRILPMPLNLYLDEWFESDVLKGALGGYGITGLQQGPRAAGTVLMFLYQNGNGFLHHRFVAGGMGQVSAVLAAAAQHMGAEVWTGVGVARLSVNSEQYSVNSVVLESGEKLRAKVVLSSLDPKRTFLGLVGAQNLEPHFMRHVRNIIYRGSTAKVNLALSGLPEFVGQRDKMQLSGHVRIAPSLDYLEKAYDAAKYGRYSPAPYLDITIPTLLDPSLAPDGQQIMAITMQYAPYELREGNWDMEREALGDHIVDRLSAYAPNLKELILQRQVITPLDWERSYSLTEGSIHHGQMGLDQLLVMRPVPGWGQYRTPIANLYLCGAGTHPGGGVTGAPGYNAAREVLRKM